MWNWGLCLWPVEQRAAALSPSPRPNGKRAGVRGPCGRRLSASSPRPSPPLREERGGKRFHAMIPEELAGIRAGNAPSRSGNDLSHAGNGLIRSRNDWRSTGNDLIRGGNNTSRVGNGRSRPGCAATRDGKSSRRSGNGASRAGNAGRRWGVRWSGLGWLPGLPEDDVFCRNIPPNSANETAVEYENGFSASARCGQTLFLYGDAVNALQSIKARQENRR